MTQGDSSAVHRTTQFLEEENKRLVRPPGRVPKAHLAGSVGRNVGLGGASTSSRAAAVSPFLRSDMKGRARMV
jgi:hypothetical protein